MISTKISRYTRATLWHMEDEMALFDDDRPKKVVVHELGQDLSLLSVGELDERIAMLKAEIDRLETDKGQKAATKNAAESLFRKGS